MNIRFVPKKAAGLTVVSSPKIIQLAIEYEDGRAVIVGTDESGTTWRLFFLFNDGTYRPCNGIPKNIGFQTEDGCIKQVPKSGKYAF